MSPAVIKVSGSANVTRSRSAGTVFFFQAEDGIRDYKVTGVQTCALPIYPAGQIAQPQSQARRLQVGRRRATQEGVELAQPAILPAVVTEVFPRIEAGCHRLRCGDRGAFVDDQLAQRRP